MSTPENPQPQPPQDPYAPSAPYAPPQNPYAQPAPQNPYAPGPYQSPMPMVQVVPRTSPLAVWSLVLGIASFLASWIALFPVIGWFTPLFPLAAVILGHMALGQIRREGLGGRGMAITGLVLGYVFIALDLLLILGVVVIGAILIGTAGTIGTAGVVGS